MKRFLTLLYYIGIVLLFMPGFVFFVVPNTSAFFPCATIPVGILYILCFLLYKNSFIKFLKNIMRLKFMKYYLGFFCIIVLSILVHKFLGYNKAPQTYYLIRYMQFFAYFILLYFFPVIALYLRIPFKKIVRVFYFMIFTIFIIGFIQYISLVLNISIINDILAFFNNVRSTELLQAYNQSALEQLRVNAIFQEPSAFGKFIFMVMPLIIISALTKYRIFAHKIFDTFYKITIIPMMLLSVIFTKSPIYLILCLAEFFILMILLNFNFIKKNFLKILLMFTVIFTAVILVLVGQYENLEKTYINRIFVALGNIMSLERLAVAEPSLATRVIYYASAIKVFKDNFFWGCGLFNLNVVWNKTFMNYDLPITLEILKNYYRIPYAVSGGANFACTLLAETGIFGTLLYYFKAIKIANRLKFFMPYFNKIEIDFCKGLSLSIICFLVISFYNLSYDFTIIPLLLGLGVVFILKPVLRYEREKQNRRN